MAVFTLMLKIFILPFLFHSVSSAVYTISPFQSLSDNGTTLVSKEGSFELGFFSPGNSKNRYVGIWYKNIPLLTVVWVANGCKPINDTSGVLMINNIGNLVLLYQNTSVAWSTSSSKQAQKPIVELLESGNIVLRDEEDANSENYLWQSFDYPSDTLLPGMKMGWDFRTGIRWSFAAWKSWDDPCPGDFISGIEFAPQLNTLPEAYMWKGTSKVHRTGSWFGLSFSGSPDIKSNFYYYGIVYKNDEVYYTYSLKNKSVVSRIYINQTTGSREHLTWIEADQTWGLDVSVPTDECDRYGICGSNANCMINDYPMCQCLIGFKPKSPDTWNSMDWSYGCVQNTTQSCEHKDKDVFVKLSGLKLPDTSRSWMAENLNLEECRTICLNNCSCIAYTNSDIRGNGSGCVIWYGDLMDIRTHSHNGQDLFIRVSNSEPDLIKERSKRDDSRVRAVIVGAVIGGVSVVLLLGYCICRRGSKGRYKATAKDRSKEEDFELPLFSLAAISNATNNFSVNNKLGEGGFGPVYRGKLEDGQEIAVKRLSLSSRQGINEFKNEVLLIAKLQHRNCDAPTSQARNLVKLLGCCIQGEEKLLIYEYMPNKSLDFFIFDQQQSKLLEWPKRFEILSGVARGLQYLHQDSRLRIVHRDLKASNILLDNKMNPKISDFGMAKTFGGDQTEGNTNRIAGTHGYMAPEYAFNGLFSTKSDIFSFGIMVLEIISGKRSIRFHHENHNITLIGQAWKLLNEGRPFELIDVHLRDSYNNLSQVLRCIHVGLLCVQQRSEDRPSISSVVLMLGSESELPQPKPPGYYMETASQERNYVSSKLESFSENTMTITAFGGR